MTSQENIVDPNGGLTLWFFEIYLKNEAGERGCDIKVGTVRNVRTKEAAERKLRQKFGNLFDCVISLYQVGRLHSSDEFIHIDGAI